MFTGIAEELGKIKAMDFAAKSVKITIEAKKVLVGLKIGDSISVNGTCLTVVSFTQHNFTADVMPETVKSTVLSQLKNGSVVNLEPALMLTSRLGGHMVSGHVDGLGTITGIKKDDNAILFTIDVKADIAKYIVKKGSVAVDGISLTVVDCTSHGFTVSLIPHTAEVTAFGAKKIGDFVNIETDMVGKYIERFLTYQEDTKSSPEIKITTDFLQKYGF